MLTRERLTLLCRAREDLRLVGPGERSIAQIAERSALSRYHFIRQFKAVFGESPVRFRTRERLTLAKRLLAREGATVTDVCMAVGFSSLGSFSTLFARRFGQSPSSFQQAQARSNESLEPGCMCLMRRSWENKKQI